jgi:methionine-gamma-lyase
MAIKRKSATIAIHGNEDRWGKNEPVSPPMYHTTTYILPNSDSVEGYTVRGERKHYLYQRHGNPAQDLLEERMALLENSEDALFLASGMAAITTAVLTAMNDGEELIAIPALYGVTVHFFRDELKNHGKSSRFVSIEDLYDLEKIVTSKTKLVYFETPTNPNVQIVDIERVVKQAAGLGIRTMIDNTFASPSNQNPISLGVDFVVHSATKYLGGHSDILAGAITGKKDFIKRCREHCKIYGPVIDPFNVFLLLRSLATLEIRVQRQNENAQKLAEFFASHSKINKVFYPGLKDDPYHDLAAKQMNGFGGIMAVEVNGGKKEAMNVIDNLEIALNAVSVGGVETLVSIPVLTSHSGLSDDELNKANVTPSMLRISAGLEDVNDLISDFDQALRKV